MEDPVNKYRKYIGDNEFLEEFLGPALAKATRKTDRHRKDDTRDDAQAGPDVFVFQKSPQYITAQLREYQIEGLNWLVNMHENGINCILADEMGLGKTIQAISLLGYLKYIKRESHTSLVIVPKSTLENWRCEFKKFLPDFRARIFHASKKDCAREGMFIYRKNYDACITTYEMCLLAKKIFRKVKWSYVIIDEAHRIKNENSMLSTVVRVFRCEHRLLLTGTPLQNNIRELWALLNFIAPEVFNDGERFEDWVNRAGESESSIGKLRDVLQLFFLRREKSDVEKSLLPKKVINLYAGLSAMQRQWYKMILQRDLSPLLGQSEKRSMLMNVVMQLKKCCNHPYLFPEAEPGPPYTTDSHIIDNAGKMVLLEKLLRKLHEDNSRVLLFSQMARMIDILEDYCVFREYEYCRIDGMTLSEDRTRSINEFNKENSSKFIFLLTTRAGGLGINLATADVVILYDTDWNPQADLQAQDRAHRIGQKKQVVVYRLITENTVEVKIVERAMQKLKLDEILMQKKEQMNSINNRELLDILATGVDRINDEVKVADDIRDIIRTGEEKTKVFEADLEKTSIMESGGKQINAYEFEGENYSVKKLKELFPVQKEHKKRKLSLFSMKRPEVINFPFFQFYPAELHALQERESELFKQGQALSGEEQSRKKTMLGEGFATWTRKDFGNFVRAMCTYGKHDLTRISEAVERSEDEVRTYSDVFWQRYKEVPEYEKIISQVEKAEMLMKRNEVVKKKFMEKSEDTNFQIPYLLNTRSKLYPDYLDMFLLECYVKHCDTKDPAHSIFVEVRKNVAFRFNYFVKTRTPADLYRRTNTLINGLLKDSKQDEHPT